MSDPKTMQTHVDVAVDAATAFKVFTEEMGRWWLPGPINYFDSSRTVDKRCEPGVGGRVMEVYDAGTGEGLEIARITEWEPGKRLAWQSSIDDVQMTFRFEPIDTGTRVVVEGRLAPGGSNKGGFAWLRVTPAWFGNWCKRRDSAPDGAPLLSRIGLILSYAKPATAAHWIHDVIGLETDMPIGHDDESEQQWIEFRLGGSLLVVWKLPEDPSQKPVATHQPMIFVDNLDAHYANAKARGATIAEEIHQHGYRGYGLEDPEGHRWFVAQSLPSMRHPA